MFPMLLPIQVVENQLNNRPLYEPWLIWRVLDIVSSGSIFDPELTDTEEFTFDLSPWWA